MEEDAAAVPLSRSNRITVAATACALCQRANCQHVHKLLARLHQGLSSEQRALRAGSWFGLGCDIGWKAR
eukprot:6124649-Pleurochrysis_carterae.AAC.3